MSSGSVVRISSRCDFFMSFLFRFKYCPFVSIFLITINFYPYFFTYKIYIEGRNLVVWCAINIKISRCVPTGFGTQQRSRSLENICLYMYLIVYQALPDRHEPPFHTNIVKSLSGFTDKTYHRSRQVLKTGSR